MNNIPEMFASMVFNDAVMKARLPKETYRALRATIDGGSPLEIDVANVVANAMKDWAIEKGATHFTHWFQPLTGITAEKHDSFITNDGDGSVIMSFSGKSLVKGEPDASSFPSGGLRSTFEARGYTAWDPTSYAFIKNGVLCIPTAFCSYSGDSLDKKTPLLRSMELINEKSLRILSLFGMKDVKRVTSQVGAEQEYFLIDKEMFKKRPDLMYTGRTLFGAPPSKGQEMDDHYFGAIKQRVLDFMKDLDSELWKLGVLAKTEHNEAAPAQHELAPIYATANIATDHNQLTMEMMKTVANRHGLACLLHEKPFACVSGSGKHNNWSLSTDTGIKLLSAGKRPHENALFLIFLCAVIKAVDRHQDLLRVSVASAGNDHRLGANEAPPAVVSIFLGDELTDILDAIENDKLYVGREKNEMQTGVNVLPHFYKDTTDRNRTSPFAFTGNKFEFRMLGSSFSIADSNTVINTIVAEALDEFADELEARTDCSFEDAVSALIKKTIKEHKRIIFNKNGYDSAWTEEAEQRGLLNLAGTPDALATLVSEKNVALFEKYRVFGRAELSSRYEIQLENYSKTVNIEALTLVDITRRDILPAVIEYENVLADSVIKKKACGVSSEVEEKLLARCSELCGELYERLEVLIKEREESRAQIGSFECAAAYRNRVVGAMSALREKIDALEQIVSKKYWPLPTYSDILYSVNE